MSGLAERYLPHAAAKLYGAVSGAGCDMSPADKAIAEIERVDAEITTINGAQVARGKKLAAARGAVEGAGLSETAMLGAVAALRAISNRPPELAEIVKSCEAGARTCAESHVEAQRRASEIERTYDEGAGKLRILVAEKQRAIVAAQAAVLAVACDRAAALGKEDAHTFKGDPFLAERPEHAPASVHAHLAEVRRLEALAETMTRPGKVAAAYQKACGTFDAVIEQAAESGARSGAMVGAKATPAGALATL